jgi:hypothetical protein
MPNQLRLSGFAELKKELAAFPTTSRDETRPIVTAHATKARDELVNAYPVVTGDLRAGVELIPRQGRGVAAVVTLRSSSDHAHFYEFGTVKAAPHATFLPISERARRESTADVVDYVEKQGLTVGRVHD